VRDSVGIFASGIAFGLVYGVAARSVGYTPLDAGLTSLVVFAGGAQFAAAAALGAGASWATIVAIVAFINARHFFYGAALAPYLSSERRAVRAILAHVLDDETFALSIAHFRRIGRGDVRGYVMAALATFAPWAPFTFIGAWLGSAIPDPARLGLDVIFPASMGGLAILLIRGRAEAVAAAIGAVTAVAVALATNPTAGIIGGALAGSVLAMGLPAKDEGEP
jgi:4-azaleucine resistance transporter AzlC